MTSRENSNSGTEFNCWYSTTVSGLVMQLKQLLIVQQVCDRPRARLPDQPYHSIGFSQI
nr:hypothetical protein [Arthrospira sp. PLM2.Bin9]